ncbi:MAG: substrate-binding domain-containing protein [Candidatus Omnitrophota bacterium]|nr:substrate-binding domain-containing protein [Candidatus Omnitrophota bacterium]MDZ4241294.1 substrate-binding domain-containing protein [Candidatus Omnitrophota bacterium]
MLTSKKRKTTFLLIIPSFEDIFHSFYAGEIIKGVSLAASRLKIDILIHITDRFDHRSWLNSSLLEPKYIDGIIFADIDNDLSVVRRVISKKIPTMVLNNAIDEPVNCIAIDNREVTHKIVEHLVKLGHTRIATIAGDMSTQAGQMRLEGFKEALAKRELDVPKSYITYGDFLRTPARIAATKLLALKERPTAVFAASDVMALELMDVARSQGLRVPEDLSVVGFDDNPLIMNSPVPLTTVFQPIVEMGRLGAENLKKICLGDAKLPVKLTLAAKLVTRKSTAAVHGGKEAA